MDIDDRLQNLRIDKESLKLVNEITTDSTNKDSEKKYGNGLTEVEEEARAKMSGLSYADSLLSFEELRTKINKGKPVYKASAEYLKFFK